MKAKAEFVCVGLAPVEGCGVALTIFERRRGTACEYCELAFQQRFRAWNLGDADPELDQMFGATPRRDQVPRGLRQTRVKHAA